MEKKKVLMPKDLVWHSDDSFLKVLAIHREKKLVRYEGCCIDYKLSDAIWTGKRWEEKSFIDFKGILDKDGWEY